MVEYHKHLHAYVKDNSEKDSPLGEPPGEWGVAGKLRDGRPESPTSALSAPLDLFDP